MEVELAARKLAPYNLQFLYSSDFMRDTETKFILASRLGISGLDTEYDARTWDTGMFSGRPESEVNPAILEIYKQPWNSAPGGSESMNDFASRWTSFLDAKMNLAAQVESFRPLGIITHGRNIAMTESYLTGRNTWECDMPMPAGHALISIGDDCSINFEIVDPKESVAIDR